MHAPHGVGNARRHRRKRRGPRSSRRVHSGWIQPVRDRQRRSGVGRSLCRRPSSWRARKTADRSDGWLRVRKGNELPAHPRTHEGRKRLASDVCRASMLRAVSGARDGPRAAADAPVCLDDASLHLRITARARSQALDTLRGDARLTAPDIDIRLASEITLDALTDMVASIGADLVAVDSDAHDAIPVVAELRKRTTVAVLYVPGDTAPTRPGGRLLCVGPSTRERRAMATFLSAHTGRDDRAVLLSGTALSDQEIHEVSDIAGVTLDVESFPGTAGTVRRLLSGDSSLGADLIVLPRFPPPLLLPRRRGCPVLILPSLRATGTEWARTIDLPDLIDDGSSIRVRAEYAVGVGRRTPIADQELAFVRDGSVVARARHRRRDLRADVRAGRFARGPSTSRPGRRGGAFID